MKVDPERFIVIYRERCSACEDADPKLWCRVCDSRGYRDQEWQLKDALKIIAEQELSGWK